MVKSLVLGRRVAAEKELRSFDGLVGNVRVLLHYWTERSTTAERF